MTTTTHDLSTFRGELAFLSNFYPASVVLPEHWPGDGDSALTENLLVEWPTVEHYFAAMKAVHRGDRERIRKAPTPGQAKNLGRKVTLRPDWGAMKLGVMRFALQAKFTQHEELRAQLLATGDAHLEERNTWGDTVWGTVNGEGQNLLGVLLMELRDELRASA